MVRGLVLPGVREREDVEVAMAVKTQHEICLGWSCFMFDCGGHKDLRT